jgi:hypothetical protein
VTACHQLQVLLGGRARARRDQHPLPVQLELDAVDGEPLRQFERAPAQHR